MANPNPFTPEEVAQILEAFFAAVGTRQYIGARYVPIFGRKGEESIIWDNSAPYEPLTVVLYQGNSYTSRQYVPEGVEITNEEFWAQTGNYNAQIEQYRRETQRVADSLYGYVRHYADVAEMQADTDIRSGMVCHTNGYTTEGDGNTAYYLIESNETEGSIPCSNGFYARFIPDSGLTSLDVYQGATNEDKLTNALDSISYGIILCGDVTITKRYVAKDKDYRRIAIVGGTFDLTIDGWFDSVNATSNTVPKFDSCTIHGNGHTIFANGHKLVGAQFNSCVLIDTIIYNDENNYIQSPYIANCEVRFDVPNASFIKALRTYNLCFSNTRIEWGSGNIIVLNEPSSNFYAAEGFTITNCLIEGRLDTIFVVNSGVGMAITNCYFETNNKGILQVPNVGINVLQLSITGCFITDSNTLEVNPLRLGSRTSDRIFINNNTIYLPGNFSFIDKTYNTQRFNAMAQNNFLPSNSIYNDGERTPTVHALHTPRPTCTFDTSDNSWNFDLVLPNQIRYRYAQPLIASIGNIPVRDGQNYKGYVVAVICPIVGLIEGEIPKLAADATIIAYRTGDFIANKGTEPAITITPESDSPTQTEAVTLHVKITGYPRTSITTPPTVNLIMPSMLVTTQLENTLTNE